jgi:hypothetical protein
MTASLVRVLRRSRAQTLALAADLSDQMMMRGTTHEPAGV